MTITTNRSKTVIVDRGYHWRPIDRHTPRSQKLQLIHERDGVAMYGTIGAARDAWTHWAPLPSFAPQHRPDADDLAGFPAAPIDDLTDSKAPPWSFGLVLGHIAGLLFLALSLGWIVDSLTN